MADGFDSGGPRVEVTLIASYTSWKECAEANFGDQRPGETDDAFLAHIPPGYAENIRTEEERMRSGGYLTEARVIYDKFQGDPDRLVYAIAAALDDTERLSLVTIKGILRGLGDRSIRASELVRFTEKWRP